MRHEVRWSRNGWAVVSLLGSMVIAWSYFDSHGEALRAHAELS